MKYFGNNNEWKQKHFWYLFIFFAKENKFHCHQRQNKNKRGERDHPVPSSHGVQNIKWVTDNSLFEITWLIGGKARRLLTWSLELFLVFHGTLSTFYRIKTMWDKRHNKEQTKSVTSCTTHSQLHKKRKWVEMLMRLKFEFPGYKICQMLKCVLREV